MISLMYIGSCTCMLDQAEYRAYDMQTLSMYCICCITQIDADTYWNEQHTSHAAKMVSGTLLVDNCPPCVVYL